MPEPSPYFRQHHGLEPPAVDDGTWRPYWRVRTRLDRLVRDGAITPHEWHSAVRLREICETAQAGIVPIHRLDRGVRGRVAPTQAPRRADALARLDEVRIDLGSVALDLLQACLVDDRSWAWLGQRLSVDPKTARAWTISAIKALRRIL